MLFKGGLYKRRSVSAGQPEREWWTNRRWFYQVRKRKYHKTILSVHVLFIVCVGTQGNAREGIFYFLYFYIWRINLQSPRVKGLTCVLVGFRVMWHVSCEITSTHCAGGNTCPLFGKYYTAKHSTNVFPLYFSSPVSSACTHQQFREVKGRVK